MEHIHLLVSTFDTSNVAVAHNLRSCSRPPSETKTRQAPRPRPRPRPGRPRPRPRPARSRPYQGRDHTIPRYQDQVLKKVVLIGLETKTRSRDPHTCRKMWRMLRYGQSIYFAFSQLSTVNFEIIPYAQYSVLIYREALLQIVLYHFM